jgi:transcriptional regulator with XRE-family HTH domain
VFSSRDMPSMYVKHYIAVKQPVTHGGCNHLPMAKLVSAPVNRYAENLKILIKTHDMTVAQVAERARVIPKQVYNLLNSSHDPRVKGLEKVANVFGLTTWQMLAVDFTDKPAENKLVLQLLELFSEADVNGRTAIMQVAEMAANRTRKSA